MGGESPFLPSRSYAGASLSRASPARTCHMNLYLRMQTKTFLCWQRQSAIEGAGSEGGCFGQGKLGRSRAAPMCAAGRAIPQRTRIVRHCSCGFGRIHLNISRTGAKSLMRANPSPLTAVCCELSLAQAFPRIILSSLL